MIRWKNRNIIGDGSDVSRALVANFVGVRTVGSSRFRCGVRVREVVWWVVCWSGTCKCSVIHSSVPRGVCDKVHRVCTGGLFLLIMARSGVLNLEGSTRAV